MLPRIIATVERHGMLQAGQRIGVAVSGGADSVSSSACARGAGAALEPAAPRAAS